MKKNVIVTSILMGALIVGPAVFAGNPGQPQPQPQQPGQSGQTGQAGQSGQGGHDCGGFFKKIGDSFKKGFKAGKKAGTKVFDKVQNKVADSGVAVKKAVTGKKCKTFVAGHYNKKGVHVKGHFRKVGGK